MSNREPRHNKPSESLDKWLEGMPLSCPGDAFAQQIMERLPPAMAESGKLLPSKAKRISSEWKNGLIAAAATLVFIAGDIPARIASMDSVLVGSYIQGKVLSAVDYGIQLIRMI